MKLLLKPFNEFIGILLSLYHLDVIWRISIHHNKLKMTINFSLEMNHNNKMICSFVNHDVTTKHNTQINAKIKTKKLKKKTFFEHR
jgi:hypothetical protein